MRFDDRFRQVPSLILFVCPLLILGCKSTNAGPKAEAEAIAHSIPMESTPEQVKAYLDELKIEHSQYQKNSIGDGVIEGILRDSSKWEIVRTSYGVVFQFDDKKHLRSIKIEPHYTGP